MFAANGGFEIVLPAGLGRVETAAVGLPRSRAGVSWKSQSGQKRPVAVTFHLSLVGGLLSSINAMSKDAAPDMHEPQR